MSPRNQLDALVHTCGGFGNAAFLLGLSRATVQAFAHKQGRISAIGALLVSDSKYLRSFFKKEILRPDCSAENWAYYRRHSFYKKARQEQIENEKSTICESLPISVLRENQCR